ncbi:antichymotrypsin-2-like [Bicyclus anynana]|uniref:Antichymotrypsin-2-like n=1 Tax=Bicyclus anynana TaxID=110368 RepID=A0ABM3LH27_BICAN|nr:antichymotrypsin-2-like [Bicyclus anynana]
MKGKLSKTFFLAITQPRQNKVCSPLSALLPLGKLALGADGKSLEELLAAIGISKKSQIQDHFKPLIQGLQYLPGVRLDIANRLYVAQNVHIDRNFASQSKEIFDASAVKLEFQYPTYAAEEINSWVSSQTNYMIHGIVSASDITPSTSMLLINAVYFNGRWKEAFKKVENRIFHTPMGRQMVPMMRRKGIYNYTNFKALNAKIIEIPYVGEKASFIIVKPNAREGLAVLLNQLKLAPELLDTAIAKMTETIVDLIIPKFKLETTSNLKDLYEQAEVKQIFNQTDSGLTGITQDGVLYVSSAKQKAFLEIHQHGAEAAASSAVAITKLSYQSAGVVDVDRPFLFFILANSHQLFSGTLYYPLLT